MIARKGIYSVECIKTAGKVGAHPPQKITVFPRFSGAYFWDFFAPHLIESADYRQTRFCAQDGHSKQNL